MTFSRLFCTQMVLSFACVSLFWLFAGKQMALAALYGSLAAIVPAVLSFRLAHNRLARTPRSMLIMQLIAYGLRLVLTLVLMVSLAALLPRAVVPAALLACVVLWFAYWIALISKH